MSLLYDKEKLEIEILLVVRCSLQTFLHELRKLKKVPMNAGHKHPIIFYLQKGWIYIQY